MYLDCFNERQTNSLCSSLATRIHSLDQIHYRTKPPSLKRTHRSMMLRIVGSLALVASCVAYQPGKAPAFSRTWLQDRAAPVAAAFLTAVVTTQLPALATTDVAASTTAAQISLNRIPPTSISIQVSRQSPAHYFTVLTFTTLVLCKASCSHDALIFLY